MTILQKLTASIFLAIFLFNTGNPNHKNLTKQSPETLTTTQWQEDFDELYTLLKTNHRNLYHKHSKQEFDQLFKQIKTDIPKFQDHEIIVKFAQFVAFVNDGHTRLTLPLQKGIGLNQAHSSTPLPSDSNLVFRHLPVEFYLFDDGLHIIESTKSYQSLIGRKVIKINNTPVEKALEKASSVSHFDNESGYKLIAPSRLSILEVLQALKITNNEKVALTIEKGNTTENITLDPLSRFTRATFIEINDLPSDEKPIISRQNNEKYYWFEYIENFNAIYLQINRMNDSENGPDIITFIGKLNEFVKLNKVDRIILDLRNNFGGDNTYSRPIVDFIAKNPQLNKIGNFYTLIGRKTFSAAQYLVNDLRKWTNVIFVGEPTGASPNSYGDSKKFQLTNSNLTIRISSIYWRDWTSDEHQEWITPDVPTPPLASDYFSNKDKGLQNCLNYKTGENLVDTYENLYKTGGMKTAERIYLRIALDWERSKKEISSVENKLVEWMSKK